MNRRNFLASVAALAAAASFPAVRRVLPPRTFVNILDFGADPTGRIDSSAALKRAIAALTEGGTVYLPSGTYLMPNFFGHLLLPSVTITGADSFE